MFITGKCRICGCPVGLEASDLGRKPPPSVCGRCSAEAGNIRDLFRELSGLELGDLTAPRDDTTDKTAEIARLNDLARTAMGVAGRVVQTPGINALSPEDQSAIREKVEAFKDFTPDDDPYGEHDFGAFEHKGERIFWKIDYYDPVMEYASDDPSDPEKTVRLLTIMLASEY